MSKPAIIALCSSIAIAILVGIFAFSPKLVHEIPLGNDKINHFLAFAAIVFPIAMVKPRWLIAASLLAIAYGGAIEVIQPYFGDTRSVFDWLADILGVLAGGGAGLVLGRTILSNVDRL
jgi:VanZ family protein